MNLGHKGIFISDKAIDSLDIPVDKEIAKKAKFHIDQDGNKEQERTCYILNKNYKQSEGIFLNPNQIADALEKSLNVQKSISDDFRAKILRCECGSKIKFSSDKIICPSCEKKINVKRFGKKIKLSKAKELTFKLYIKSLRKKK